MSGKTTDISQYCKLELFKWVILQDKTAPFPHVVQKLDCYLGPSIDVSPAMPTKIPTDNEQVLQSSMHRPLTPDELGDKNGSDAQEQVMARVYERLGS